MNKRILKKEIRRICGECAGECIIAAHFIDGVSTEEMHNVVRDIAALQTTSLSKVSIAFDKVPSDFDNAREYRKARRQYFQKAFAAFHAEFAEKLQSIVDAMNAAMPHKKET